MTSVPSGVSKVSEAPPKNAVTQSFTAKQKKEDVDRKLRLFAVVQAFREGKLPDNKQIDETLQFALKNSPVDLKDLSDDGRKLVEDFRAIINTARKMVLEKNSKEEFQNFIAATMKSSPSSQTSVKAPVSGADAKKDAENAGEAFRTIVKLFLRNGEFRKLVEDAGVIGRDVFSDAAVKASEISRPDEERLATVDHPAPEGEFHDDIPQALQSKNPETKEAEQRQRDAEKEAAVQRAKEAANSMDPNNIQSEQNKTVANQKATEQKEALLAKIPDKHKETAKDYKNRTVNYGKEKFPKERRDQYIYRLKKVLVECQRHRDWQDSMSYIVSLFENYKGHAENMHDQTLNAAKDVRSEGAASSAETNFRRLIEKFANGRPTQPLMDAIDQIYTDVKRDPELRDWFKRLDSYIRRCLLEPGFVMKDEADTEARQLRESGKKFFVSDENRDHGKYKPHFDKIWDELTTFTDGFAEDPLNKRFGEQWQQLFKDLIYDERGAATFKGHLVQDMVQTILPQFLQHVSFVPLPRIEYTDPQVDLVVENIAAAPINLLPNMFEFEANNYFKASAFKGIDNRHRHSFKLTLSQVHLEMRDVYFEINKKQGFKIKDHGFADIFLGGQGMTVTAQIEGGNEPRGRRAKNVFVVKTVKAKIDNLDFAIRKSNHDLAIKVFRPLAKSIIKKQIAKAAEAGIRDGLEKLDQQLTDARNAVYDAEQGAKGDALKQKMQKEKDQKQAQAQGQSQGTFKIPTSKRESVLPSMGTKQGWISKLDEYSEGAKQTPGGVSWKSPNFSITHKGTGVSS